MAARRSLSVCLSCQFRQSLIGRRRIADTARRRQETQAVALRPEDDGFFLTAGEGKGMKKAETSGTVLPLDDTVRQWKLHSPVDGLRDALLGFEALYKRKDMRIHVLRNLSNPWPELNPTQPAHQNHFRSKLRLPEANAALIPHAVFRKKIQEALHFKDIRKILRTQLLRCEWPAEILRVVAVAMQHKLTAQNLVVLSESMMRALYRCRNNVSDPEVLKVINTIVWRFDLAGLQAEKPLLQMGLKFAARARSLSACKNYLKIIRERGIRMTSNIFRAVIAKMSIGFRGLGEIRNGRWQREQLKQVLKGFDDAAELPESNQYHLGSFLDRSDWSYLHGWIAVLSRCKDSEAVWQEWELWKGAPARLQPRKLENQGPEMTSRMRGDLWFVEQMALSGDLEKAWKVLEETGLDFAQFRKYTRLMLLDGIEHARVWNDDVRDAMLQKYEVEIEKVEKALGVRWVATSETENQSSGMEGRHELVGSQEEALEALGADDWKFEENHGFPHGDVEEEALVPESNVRALHDAEEEGLAEDMKQQVDRQ